jgi:hypothetical protein
MLAFRQLEAEEEGIAMPRTNGPRTPTPDPAALPDALLAMTLHIIESRVALLGELTRCGTAAEAGEAMSRWMSRRVEEFSADQARVAEAMFAGFAQAATAATEAVTTAGGLAKAGLDVAAAAAKPGTTSH